MSESIDRLNALAPRLLEALRLAEKAEQKNMNCPDCEGEEIPELCPRCFPSADAARAARREVLAAAKGIKIPKPDCAMCDEAVCDECEEPTLFDGLRLVSS